MIWIKCIWAMVAIAVGVRWVVQRKVEVGIESHVPALVLGGRKAVAIGSIAILIGLFVLLKLAFDRIHG